MEVGQGPNWGCSAKEKTTVYYSGPVVFRSQKTIITRYALLKKKLYNSYV
jgi:hypothetical protein